MPASVRIGDSVSCGDVMAEGSGNTFAEGIPMSRKDPVDYTAGHCYVPTTISSASPDVFINVTAGGEAAVRLGDPIIPHCCCSIPATHGGNMSTGASHVFINSNSGAGAMIDNNPSFVTLGTQEPDLPPYDYDITSADVYVYSNNDIPGDPDTPPSGTSDFPMEETQDDQTPPPTDAPPVQDCTTIDSLPADYNWSTDSGAANFLEFASTFALSNNFTVYDMCYGAVGKHTFSTSITQNSGLTQKEILLNMCHHAKIILEPMLATYGAFTITSGFRNNSDTSQHNKGQASDMQFLNLHGNPGGQSTGDLYFARAQDVRDNINFDQFILEWFGNNPWLHVSSNPSGHRHNALTQVSRTSYASGLKLLRRS